MKKHTPTAVLVPVEGTDSSYYSGYQSGFLAGLRKADLNEARLQEMQDAIDRYERTVTDLEVQLALANSRIIESELLQHTDTIICTEADPDLLQASKSMITVLDLIQSVLKSHDSSFPVTENLAVLNLKTAIRKAEGLE